MPSSATQVSLTARNGSGVGAVDVTPQPQPPPIAAVVFVKVSIAFQTYDLIDVGKSGLNASTNATKEIIDGMYDALFVEDVVIMVVVVVVVVVIVACCCHKLYASTRS
jgi:ABC-type sugar transport system permease subunit